MTNLQKKEIVETIEVNIDNLGSQNAVANKCKVSPATISQMRKEHWELIRDEMWKKVADALNHDFEDWNIAPTTNVKMVKKTIEEAKSEGYFIPISETAGAGKSTGIQYFLNNTETKNNYAIVCRNWGAKRYLLEIINAIGLPQPKGYNTVDDLLQSVIDFFVKIKRLNPALIVDQANSLKKSALTVNIHLFNALEDEIALVIVGTKALKKIIQNGVRYDIDGFDELESRLGRNYMDLLGNTLNDAKKMAEYNGITDVKKVVEIFDECKPTIKKVTIGDTDTTIKVVADGRRLKRVIKRERKKLRKEAVNG